MSYNEWKTIKVKEIAEKIFSGGTPSTKKMSYWNGTLNWLSSGETRNRFILETEKNISKEGANNSSTKLAKINDIVIASAGQGNTRGQTSLIKIETYINQSLIDIRVNANMANPIFVFYNIGSRYNEIRKISDGHSIRGSLTTKMIGELEVKLPSLEEQKAIAKILSDLDEKIEINNKINKNLEEMAQAIFKRWFVDFEFPNQEGKPYKTSGGEMVESELGMIPKGWEIKSLEELCLKITDGSHFSPKNSNKGIYPMLSVKDMRNYGFEYSECKKIKKDDYQKMINTDCVPKKDDILVAKDGSYLKHIFIVNEEKENAILSSIAIFRVDNSKIYPEILLNILKNPILQKKVKENFVSGSALPRIVLKDFKRLKIVIATIELQSQIQKKLKKYNEKIYNNILENAKLENLRDVILPKLMSGEVRIPLK